MEEYSLAIAQIACDAKTKEGQGERFGEYGAVIKELTEQGMKVKDGGYARDLVQTGQIAMGLDGTVPFYLVVNVHGDENGAFNDSVFRAEMTPKKFRDDVILGLFADANSYGKRDFCVVNDGKPVTIIFAQCGGLFAF